MTKKNCRPKVNASNTKLDRKLEIEENFEQSWKNKTTTKNIVTIKRPNKVYLIQLSTSKRKILLKVINDNKNNNIEDTTTPTATTNSSNKEILDNEPQRPKQQNKNNKRTC